MYENLFNIHLDLIYDRLSLINLDTKNIETKLKSLFPESYKLALSYLDIIEETLNLYLPSSEFIFIILLCLYINNL